MAKRIRTRRIKKNQTYSVEELAETTCVTQATVRNWIKAGMQVLDPHRPLLILGFQAQEFLKKRAAKGKRPLAPGEVFCVGCKTQRMPDGLLVDYVPASSSGGRLVAICGVCGGICNRPVSLTQVAEFSAFLEIVTRATERD